MLLQFVNVSSAGLFPSTSGVLGISDITQYFDHVNSSSISQIIKGKSRDIQKLFKYFNKTTTSAFNLLLVSGVLPTNLSYDQKTYLLLSSF